MKPVTLLAALALIVGACSNVQTIPTNTPIVPTAPSTANFRPVAVGQGACLGVADPDYTPPANRPSSYAAPEDQKLDTNKTYCAILTTEKGRIVIQLYPEVAPQHVNSFIFLARQGFYDGTTFHRVVPNFVAQGGDPTGTGTGGPGYRLPLEVSPLVSYDRVGVVGMARTNEPNSAGSQFFITYAPVPSLNPSAQSAGYTIFGQVVEGMDVVQRITPRDPQTATRPGDRLVSVRIVELDKR
ncbi:MAG: peptidylprolyl isomerase [Anaerolineae bacterium]|nr:peptidylprolyl isomerase [Anaerolineae bacterium]